jgi:hypothetical protein
MLENLLVGAIVVAAVFYAAWSLTPGSARRNLTRHLADWGRRPGRSSIVAHATSALEQAAVRKSGDCSNCGASHAPRATEQRRNDG